MEESSSKELCRDFLRLESKSFLNERFNTAKVISILRSFIENPLSPPLDYEWKDMDKQRETSKGRREFARSALTKFCSHLDARPGKVTLPRRVIELFDVLSVLSRPFSFSLSLFLSFHVTGDSLSRVHRSLQHPLLQLFSLLFSPASSVPLVVIACQVASAIC